MQKKELLLHCLADDLSAGLGNLAMAVSLIEIEERPTQLRQLLQLASSAIQKQITSVRRSNDPTRIGSEPWLLEPMNFSSSRSPRTNC